MALHLCESLTACNTICRITSGKLEAGRDQVKPIDLFLTIKEGELKTDLLFPS